MREQLDLLNKLKSRLQQELQPKMGKHPDPRRDERIEILRAEIRRIKNALNIKNDDNE